jgi:hypothetical protein
MLPSASDLPTGIPLFCVPELNVRCSGRGCSIRDLGLQFAVFLDVALFTL